MNNKKTSKSLSALLLATSATSLCAIERPVPAELPNEKPAIQEKPLAMPEVKVAQRPFLGVIGAPVSEAMSTQLGLVDGIGLTLQHVNKNTPADKLGLKKHDIITQIGGKDIGNQIQLRNAILKHKPNETVELKYISGGKAITKQVTLGAADKHLGQIRDRGRAGRHPMRVIPRGAFPKEMLENLPPEHRKQLEQLLQGECNKLDFRKLKPNQRQTPLKELKNKQRLELNFDELMNNTGSSKARMKMVDPDGSVTLETQDDKKKIEFRDIDGKLLYTGPFNTKEDKLKIPENLRKRANKIQLPQIKRHRLGKKDNAKPQGKHPLQDKGLELPEELKQLLKQGNAKGFVFPQNGQKLNFKELKDLELPDELKQLMKQGNAQGFVLPGKGLKLPQGRQMKELKLNGGIMMHSSSTMVDPATGNRYTNRQDTNGKEVEIKDKAGKLLYSGPYNSSSDYEMVPEEYRSFLSKLGSFNFLKGNKKDGFKLKIEPKQ